jgi:predicted nucleic acid-binding protein
LSSPGSWPKNCNRCASASDFLPYAAIITVSSTLADVPRSRDPADQMFLSLAVAGRADAFVTGDKHLLDLRHASPDPPIMSLAKFRRWFDQLRFE